MPHPTTAARRAKVDPHTYKHTHIHTQATNPLELIRDIEAHLVDRYSSEYERPPHALKVTYFCNYTRNGDVNELPKIVVVLVVAEAPKSKVLCATGCAVSPKSCCNSCINSILISADCISQAAYN